MKFTNSSFHEHVYCLQTLKFCSHEITLFHSIQVCSAFDASDVYFSHYGQSILTWTAKESRHHIYLDTYS